jgi:hypothetical protein
MAATLGAAEPSRQIQNHSNFMNKWNACDFR